MLSPGSAAAAHKRHDCGWLRGTYKHTPYKVHLWAKSKGPNCRYARRVVRAAFEGRIKEHVGRTHAGSWDIYGPYRCWGNMGYYGCWRPPSQRQVIVAHYWFKYRGDHHWTGWEG
jgi:hypothetical protein